jgi:hypothetical protein
MFRTISLIILAGHLLRLNRWIEVVNDNVNT